MLMDNDELLLSRIQLVGVTFSDFMLLFLIGKWRVGFAWVFLEGRDPNAGMTFWMKAIV